MALPKNRYSLPLKQIPNPPADPSYVATEHDLKIKPGSFHSLIQDHPSGRKTMYVSSHADKVVGWSDEEGLKWNGPGDMVMWDNRSVMHRATEWKGSDTMVRDMRRTSVLDDTKDAYGVSVAASA